MFLRIHIALKTDADGVFFAATCPDFDDLLQGFGGRLQSDLGDEAFVFYTRKKTRIEADAFAMILGILAGRMREAAAMPKALWTADPHDAALQLTWTFDWTPDALDAP